jgi:hypothetical protein
LNKLHQSVLEHNLARCGRYIAAELKRLVVGHRDRQPPIAPLEIREQIFKSVKQVLATGLERFADDLWIGRHEVGR